MVQSRSLCRNMPRSLKPFDAGIKKAPGVGSGYRAIESWQLPLA
jgi:hypothetical protein